MMKTIIIVGLCVAVIAAKSATAQPSNRIFSSSIHDDDKCKPVSIRPILQVTRYTFKNCITVEFGGYVSINGTKFIELKDGVIDEKKSLCKVPSGPPYGESVEPPRILINFGDCGYVKINPYAFGERLEHKVLMIRASFANTDSKEFPTLSGLIEYKDRPCVYQKMVDDIEIYLGLSDDLVLEHLNFELHKGIDKPFDGCGGN